MASKVTDIELRQFSQQYVYLDPGSNLDLIQTVMWARTFTGKRGSPIMVEVIESKWEILKNSPQAEYSAPMPTVYQYDVRVIVDIEGRREVINEGTLISIEAAQSAKSAAVEQTAQKVLIKIHRRAIELGVISQ
jgi:hypothetical protein